MKHAAGLFSFHYPLPEIITMVDVFLSWKPPLSAAALASLSAKKSGGFITVSYEGHSKGLL